MATLLPLIDVTSPLYLRRMVKELRSLEHGYYYLECRYSNARLQRGLLQGYSHDTESWVCLPPDELRDHNGEHVCASRHPNFSTARC